MTLAIVCILVEEADSWTPMGTMDKASSSHQKEVSDSRFPNPSDSSLIKVQGRNGMDIRISHPIIDPSPSMRELRVMEVAWLEISY
jgi:hypothetical protein